MKGTDYEIVFKPGCLGDYETMPLRVDENGKSFVDLEILGKRWKPGVARILAELRRRGSVRAIARSSIVFWNGLDHLTDSRFHCTDFPVNLSELLSENLRKSPEQGLIAYLDDTHRFFRMVFEDCARRHSFTWSVPGIFLSVEERGEDFTENVIKIGSTLPVSPSSRSVLKIYCTRPAVLELATFKTRVDFSSVGCKRLPLSSLLEYAGPGGRTLNLRYEGEIEPIPLVELVAPHTVFGFRESSHGNDYEIHLRLKGPAGALNISIEDILTGRKSCMELRLEKGEARMSGTFALGGRITVISSGEAAYGVYCHLNELPPGFWLFEIAARIAGRWGALADSDGNSYAGYVLLSGLGRTGAFADICLLAEELQLPAAEALLAGIHKRLLNRYSSECSNLVIFLFRLWNIMFNKLRNISSVEYFLSLLGERSSQLATSSWIPGHSLGATFPELFCYPGPKYYRVRKRSDSLIVECLRHCGKFNDPVRVFSAGIVDDAVLGGFANPAGIIGGESPRGFDFTRYLEAMRMRDLPERWSALNDDNWQPGLGDYLGPMHYRYCITRLKFTYTRTFGENLGRHGKALTLLRKVKTFSFAGLSRRHVPENGCTVTDLGLFETENGLGRLLSESDQQQAEDLQAIVRFLALFAGVCRFEARHPGILKRFLYEIREKMEFSEPADRERDLRGILSYLLYVGEELFAFYLMLSELIFVTDEKEEGKKCPRVIP